jgi:hypothetical protein
MDRILKLVYSHWHQFNNVDYPIPNGVHPVLVKHIQEVSHLHENIEEVKQDIQAENTRKVFVYDHNNFIGYHRKYFDNSTVIKTKDIIDDDTIYLYPIELRDSIDSLYSARDFIFKGKNYEYFFSDLIPLDILSHLQSGRVKLLINYIHEPMDMSEQPHFSNIENYMNGLKILGSNIIIVGGNKFNSSVSKLKFADGGLLMGQQMAVEMEFYPRITTLGYMSDIVRESDLDQNKIRDKRFLCFNRTMKPHRYVLAYLALKHDLLNENTFSFINSHGISAESIYHSLLWYVEDLTNLNEIASTIYNLIPYEIDTQHLSTNEKFGFGSENNKKELYLDTYLHITSETRFEGDSRFFSEKTYRPLMNLQPFIYVGTHHSLQKLHEMGFKTFHPFIDESYDLEEDPKKRMSMIEKEMVRFNNHPINEIHEWYYSIKDILIYNQTQIYNMRNLNPYEETYRDIKNAYSTENVNGI